MKVIKLNESEVTFIRNECKKSTLNDYLDKGQIDVKSPSLILILAIDEIEQIANILSDVLMEKGISMDGEINQFGIKVDNLIDKFNQYE